MIRQFHRSHLSVALALGLATLVGGCGGSIRVVRRAPAAGEVALVGDPDEARVQAEDYMRRQCPEGYDVIDEGEAVVGSRSSAYAPGPYGRRSSYVSITTSDTTEWRIRYQCKDALAPAATDPVPRPAPAASVARPAPAPSAAAPASAAPRPRKVEPPAAPPAPKPDDPAPSSWGTFPG